VQTNAPTHCSGIYGIFLMIAVMQGLFPVNNGNDLKIAVFKSSRFARLCYFIDAVFIKLKRMPFDDLIWHGSC